MARKMRHTALMCGVALGSLVYVSGAHAQDADKPEKVEKLDTVVISATRSQETPIEALGGVTQVTTDVLDQLQASTPANIFLGVPGVTTQENANDPASAVNVRGLQDFGRVAVTVDGARQNFQRSGHNANGVFYINPEVMKRVTVVRGPVANVFGSGAIGGVVAFETKDPDDVLRGDETYAVESKLQYSTNRREFLGSLTGATRVSNAFSVLGNVVYRKGHDYTDGAGNTVSPTGRKLVAGLAKIKLTPTDSFALTLTGQTQNHKFRSTSGGGEDIVSIGNTVTAKAEYNPDSDWINVRASSYWTSTDLVRTRGGGTPGQRDISYMLNTYGFDIYNSAEFQAAGLDHTLTVGADFFLDKVETADSGGALNLFTPDGRRLAYGGFVQHKVSYDKWIDVIGALRFDGYSLKGGTASNSGTRLSPKLTVGVKPFEGTVLEGLQVYGTYAEGYRAPSITESLITGVHPGRFVFDFLPNPNLKAETAKTLEAGINYQKNGLFTANDRFTLKAAIFQNKVKDYIGSSFNPVRREFTYVNKANVRLQGIELEAGYDAGWVFGSLAASATRGKDLSSGANLSKVPADKASLTVGFRGLDEKLTLGGQFVAVAAQNRVPTGVPKSKAYNLVNLFAKYDVHEDLQVGVNIDNLFNETYKPYLDSANAKGFEAKFTVKARFGG